MKRKYKLTVLASGRGSNFRAVQAAIETGSITNAEIVHLIVDRTGTGAADFAQKKKIPVTELLYKKCADRQDFDKQLALLFKKDQSDFYLALGFMRIFGPQVLSDHNNKIINIHPSLLPAFPGMRAQKQAFDYGVKISGCTVHFVDQGIDSGPVISQKAVDISQAKTVAEVSDMILAAEHLLIVLALKKVLESREYHMEKTGE